MNICLFCASSNNIAQRYKDMAADLGRKLAQRGDKLFYGAGNEGLMYAAAQASLDAGGYVVGVIPQFLSDAGYLHEGIQKIVATEDMQQRKKYLMENSDAIMVLPGGPGTMDEFFEAVVLKQLDKLHVPIILVNAFGFYDELLRMMDHMNKEGFMRFGSQELYRVANTIDQALEMLS